MHSSRELRFRSLLSLVLALLIPALMVAQSEVVSPSAESSSNHSLKQRLAPRTSPLQAVRLPGAPVAAERYVGRLDLATGDNPNAVATGAFQTGGP